MTDSCQICQAPLGQDSKDSDFILCHSCRKCSHCELPLTAREIKWCFDKWAETAELNPRPDLEVTHVRCSSSSLSAANDPILTMRASEFDRINMFRLMFEPDLALSDTTNENNTMIHTRRFIEHMDHERMLTFLKKLEAACEQVRIIVGTSRRDLQRLADKRDKEKEKAAKKEALTSSRPASKTVDDPEEIAIGTFMEMHGLKERKTAMKIWRDRNKAIKALMSVSKLPETAVIDMVNADLVKNGVLPK